MRIETIEEFLTFARWMNFSKAARELNMTQPALSKHMQELEKELGISLIDRETHGKNRPQLTPAGKYLFEEASQFVGMWHEIVNGCAKISRARSRELKMQELWQNRAMAMLYPLIESFLKTRPQLKISFSTLTGSDPIKALERKRFDVALDVKFIAEGPDPERVDLEKYLVVPLITETPMLWYSVTNPYLRSPEDFETLTLERLSEIPVIMSQGETYDYMAEAHGRLCRAKGLVPRFRMKQVMDGSASTVFMSDFRDSVLVATPGMVHDARLSSRADLRHDSLPSPAFDISTSVVVRADDDDACELANFIEEQLRG